MSKRILDFYLKEVQEISDMQKFLEKFKRVIKITDPIQQYVGMTIFNENNDVEDIAFQFVFDT